MKNAVIYARFSSHGQNEQTIDGQVRICREYAEKLGYNVINVYADKARSGTNDHRQDFQRMIKDAASETFQYIIVYMLDRFARNRRDSVLYKEMLKEKYNIKVLSATQQISDDEGGEFYEMFLEWNDEKYSKRLSKRIHLGLDTCVENGTYTGARLVYGYKLVDTEHKGKKDTIHKVAVDEEQANVVRYIFEQYAKGRKKQEIANSLNAKGITYKGKQYTKRTFENWLLNRKYTGKCYIGGRLCENTYPQIIDEITFEKVQKRLALNRRYAAANKPLERYLLTGKAYCGYCGSLMTADAGTGRHGDKHYYYVCHKKRKNLCHKRREDRYSLERFVTAKVQEYLTQPANAQIVAVDTINYYEQRTGDDGLKSIDARIANINREVETMTNAFIHAQSELLQLTIEKKMHEQEILLADLQKQKAQIMHERGQRLTVDKILDFITNLVQGDPNDKEYQRLLIDNLILRVYIFDDDVVPIFNLGVDKSLERLREQETEQLIDYINGVRVQTAMLHHRRITRIKIVFYIMHEYFSSAVQFEK